MYLQNEIKMLAVGAGLIACGTDLRSRRIPNWLTGSGMVAGLAMHAASGGWSEVREAICGLLLCGGLYLGFYLVGGMGAGDVKLIAAEGCLLGLDGAPVFIISTALCGGCLALLMAYKKGCLVQTITNAKVLAEHHTQNGLKTHPELNLSNVRTLRLPYAVAIAMGVVVTSTSQLFLRIVS